MENTRHVDKYFTTIGNMMERMEKKYRLSGYKGAYTLDDFLPWQKKAKEQLGKLLGLDLIEEEAVAVPFDPVVTETKVLDGGLHREKVYITVDKGVVVPSYIFYPENPVGTYIALPGHGGAGKETVAGVADCLSVIKKIEHYDYAYGLEMARRGYITVCPDARGFGERREEAMQGDEEEKFLKSSCASLAHVATALGFTLMGLLVFDIKRIIDYLETRDDIDTSDLGVIGFSGGGMQALYASALDERIRKVIISGYFYGYKDSLVVLNTNCACNYPNGVFRHFDMCDLGGMIAPRPLAIQSGAEDHLEGRRGLINTTEQLEETRRMYRIFGKEIFQDVPPGDHSFHCSSLDKLLSSLE